MATEEDAMLYQNMRAMISLVDKLRDFNLQDYISLPRIAVLGEQSAGKSSLLESIAGLNFLPRGSGIVTRRPLELRMVRSSVPTPYFVFPKDFAERKFTDPDEVRVTIEKLTDKTAGGSKNISDVPIVCTVYSATVPDLTLIDLPGITRNPTADQPENIEEITKNLVRKYCEDPNTLILCVIPANIDLSTSDALSFARKLDPQGQRTLGVLTKIDLMDEGTDAKGVLLNEEIKLRYGYVGVKGRSQAEIKNKTSVHDAIQKELDYFGKHPIYSTMPTELLGTRSLIDRTSSILYSMIKNSLPKIQREILDRKRKAKDQLDQMGDDFPDSDERKLELVFRLVRRFKDNYEQELYGKYFHETISNKRDKEKQSKRGADTITFSMNKLFHELYEEYADKNYRVTKDYNNEFIRNAIDVYQGESIPGFHSFDSFLFLIHPKIDMLKQPIHHLLDEAKNILETRGLELLDSIFKKFNSIHFEIKETFQKVLLQYKNTAKRILENILKNEENYLFTNDSLILTGEIIDANTKRKFNSQDILVEELRARIDKYFFIIVRNLRDEVPKIIGQFLVRKFNESLEVEILNALNKRDYCLDSLVENKSLYALRQKLKVELEALSKAENLLVNDFNMGFDLKAEVGIDEHIDKSNRVDNKVSFDDEFTDIIDEDLLMNIDMINDEFLNFTHAILQNDVKSKMGINTVDKPVVPNPTTSTNTTIKPTYRPADPVIDRQQRPTIVPAKEEVLQKSTPNESRPMPVRPNPIPPKEQSRVIQPENPNPTPQYKQAERPTLNNNLKPVQTGPNRDPFDIPLVSDRKIPTNDNTKNPFNEFDNMVKKEPQRPLTNPHPQTQNQPQSSQQNQPKSNSIFGDQPKRAPVIESKDKKIKNNLFGDMM